MAQDDQSACFCVIGIIIIVMTFVIWFNFFFVIIGIGFIMAGICMSQQKVKKAAYTSPQPAVQQPAPVTPTPAPQPEPPQPVAVEPEMHKFCPHCGSPATENICQTCGAKID